MRKEGRSASIKPTLWLLCGLVLASLVLTRPLCGLLRSNLATIQLAKYVVPSFSEVTSIDLPEQIRGSLVLQFQEAQGLGVNNPMASYHLGQLAILSGSYEEAIRQLSRSRKECSSPLATLLLGYALWNTGAAEEAITTWRSVPSIQWYFLTRGLMAERHRDYQLAERNYGLARRLAPGWTPGESGYWFARSINLLQAASDEGVDVETTVERAIILNPRSAERLLRLGEFLFYRHRGDLAKPALMMAIELDPRSRWPRYFLGRAYYDEQAYRLAEKRLAEAVEVAPDFAEGHLWLARTLARLGRIDEALVHYRVATDLRPGDLELADELRALEERLHEHS